MSEEKKESDQKTATEEPKSLAEAERIDVSAEKKPSGKGKWILLAVTVLAALVIGLCIYNKPENRLARQLDLGERYLEEQNYAEAVLAFEKAIQIDERCIAAYVNGIEAYRHLDELENLLVFYEKALGAARSLEGEGLAADIDAVVSIYLAAKDVYTEREAVIALLEEGYEKSRPDSRMLSSLVSVYLARAEECASNGEYEESLQDYDRLLELDDQNEVVLKSLARSLKSYIDLLLDEKNFERIKELTDNYTSVLPDFDIEVYLNSFETELVNDNGEDTNRYSFNLCILNSLDNIEDKDKVVRDSYAFYEDGDKLYYYELQVNDSKLGKTYPAFYIQTPSPDYWVPTEDDIIYVGDKNNTCLFYYFYREGMSSAFIYSLNNDNLIQLMSGYLYEICDDIIIGEGMQFAVDDGQDLLGYGWDGELLYQFNNTPYSVGKDWIYYAVPSQGEIAGTNRYDIHRCKFDRSNDEELFYIQNVSNSLWLDEDSIYWYGDDYQVEKVSLENRENISYKPTILYGGPLPIHIYSYELTQEDLEILYDIIIYIQETQLFDMDSLGYSSADQNILSFGIEENGFLRFGVDYYKNTRHAMVYDMSHNCVQEFDLP